MKSGAAPIIPKPPKKRKARLSQRKRIFAKKVARKCHAATDRFSNHSFATPIRVGLLAFAGWLIVCWPHWLPWMVIVFGAAYVSWLLMRSWAGQSELEREERRLRKTGIIPTAIRQWLKQRPTPDRFTEWLGSVLIGTLSSIVLSLFGLAVYQSIASADVEGWAFYTWLAITCSAACVGVVCCAKFWETENSENAIQRRLITAGIGLLTGIVAIVTANVFDVDMTFAPRIRTSDCRYQPLLVGESSS